MSAHPIIPDWIKRYRHPQYTQLWELIPDETRLYGTESMYGDWDGKLLILLQDFSTASEIRRRIAAGDPRPYRHDPMIRTNKILARLAEPFVKSRDPRSCGILYGSAFAGLLKQGESLSSPLRYRHEFIPYLTSVLKWAISQMPGVRAIACCGSVAWEVATTALDCERSGWREQLDKCQPVVGGRLKLYALRHPVNRDPGAQQRMQAEWNAMRQDLGAKAKDYDCRKHVAINQTEPYTWTADDVAKPATEIFQVVLTPVMGEDTPAKPKPLASSSSLPAKLVGFDISTLDGLPKPRVRQPNPSSVAGIDVAICALVRPGGVTKRELWEALRVNCPGTWNTAEKVIDGLRIVRARHGWGMYTDKVTGRTFIYRSLDERSKQLEHLQ